MSSKKKDKETDFVPLDLRVRKEVNPVTKITEEIPELDPVWVEDVEFVTYIPLPQSASNLDHAGVEEWKERMVFINEDMKWLLSLPHNRFWCQVIFDSSLQACLDSYLSYAPRKFDASSDLPPELVALTENVHKRVFMTYLRMSTHKESKEDFITPGTFGDILYENFLFDIPKIMDICALYGGEDSTNTPLLSKMLENIFSKQPKYYDDLKITIPTIFQTLEDILTRCGIKPKTEDSANYPKKISDVKNGPRTSLSFKELEDIALYLSDTSYTLQAFMRTFPKVCYCFHCQDFIQQIAFFYEAIVPYFGQHLVDVESRILKEKWKHAKTTLVKLCHVIFNACCFEPINSNSSEDEVQTCVENLLQVLTSILSEKRFLSSYDSRFNIKQSLDRLQQHSSVSLDDTRVQYILDAVDSARRAFPRHFNKKKKIVEQERESSKNGVALAVNGQDWTDDCDAGKTGFVDEKIAGATSKTVSDEELFSMVSHIQDLLPGLGDGFIILCLEELNYDVEQVVNVLLEDKLPPSLENIDRNLSKEEVMKNRTQPVKRLLDERHSVYDKDEFDVFSGSKVDLSKIQKGKRRGKGTLKSLLSDKSDITESVKERYSAYSVFDRHVRTDILYDDEYDDTYDSQNVGALDADSADELTVRRPFTIPRVLGGSPVPSDQEEESEEETPTTEESKQDTEEVDKALINRRYRGPKGPKKDKVKDESEEGGQKGRAKGRGRGVSAAEQRQRAHNERNKGMRANHNRKMGAAVKRGKGMGMLSSR